MVVRVEDVVFGPQVTAASQFRKRSGSVLLNFKFWVLSPLARGARPESNASCTASWIIPARAGSTWRIGTALVSWWDHPRSRGEHR